MREPERNQEEKLLMTMRKSQLLNVRMKTVLNKVILIIFDFELDTHFIIAAIVAAMI